MDRITEGGDMKRVEESKWNKQ